MTNPSRDEFYSRRQQAVGELLEETGATLFWVTSLANIRYLTGFTGSSAQLLISRDERVFITDGRYQEQVRSEVVGCRFSIFHQGPWTDVLIEEIRRKGGGRVAFEADHVSFRVFRKLEEHPDIKTRCRWEPTSGKIENLRAKKDRIELDLLQRSSEIVDDVFEALIPELREGVTEREACRLLMNLLWQHGAKGPSFDPIVLFGPRSSLPHGQPGETGLKDGDWVLVDFGALYEGYCSDCTRTFVFGEPDDLQKERHRLVRDAQLAALEKISSGVRCRDVDSAAREVLARKKMGEFFIHGLGHGIGLEIHEGPRLNTTSDTVLEEGMVVTVEPGIYIPGWGGIRIEDAVVVEKRGSRPLTRCDHSIQPVPKLGKSS